MDQRREGLPVTATAAVEERLVVHLINIRGVRLPGSPSGPEGRVDIPHPIDRRDRRLTPEGEDLRTRLCQSGAVDVHQLRSDEATAVAATLRHRVVVADRMERQRRDECIYLVAWEGGRPVGQVLLHRRRPAALAVAERVDALPYIEDAFVVPEWRNRGIGTALLQAAERAASDRGDLGLSLAVSTANRAAQRLYTRLGYVDSGVPAHRQTTSEHDPGGPGMGNENVVDLIKRLDGLAAAAAPVGNRGTSPGGP
jgi:GNAT superfamily N-acetyltransferase